jgi:hypothetical protein
VIAPASYESSIELSGAVEDYLEVLNPQNWSKNAHDLWRNSYLIADPGVPAGELPFPSRATMPGDAGSFDKWDCGIFFEDVWIFDFRYRNILDTSRKIKRDHKNSEKIESVAFRYWQLDCLTTDSVFGVTDGGIDVDSGEALCVATNGGVTVTFAKTVRFTEPAFLENDLAVLSHVVLPLMLDGWLHDLMFMEKKKRTPGRKTNG